MSSAVFAQNLSKQFGRLSVLDGFNLDVQESSVYGLIGPNGAGKTTTIKILMNILKPTSGTAKLLGIDSRLVGPDLLTQVGYVSENQELPDWMTVKYFLDYVEPFYPAWDSQRASELVRMFDLPLDRKLKHLSRGMRMKAALVSSLAYRPKLLVLDEPFSGLDPLVREDLIEGLVDSAGETTLFISSHDLAEIETFASHIGYLDHGRLQFSEEMTSLAARFREVEVTFDQPVNISVNGQWPGKWLRPETSPALVRFVDTSFDPQLTTSEIRELFQHVKNISVNPMPLRAIFLTMARSASKPA